MFKRIIFIYILFLQLSANDFIPSDDSVINYTQVFFKWPQIESAESYILKIQNSMGISFDFTVASNSIILNQDSIDSDEDFLNEFRLAVISPYKIINKLSRITKPRISLCMPAFTEKVDLAIQCVSPRGAVFCCRKWHI